MRKELVFSLSRDRLLNSNTMNGMHYIVKGKIVASLRELGYQTGFEQLPPETREAAEEKKRRITVEESNKLVRSRITKQVKKEHPELSKKELEAKVLEEYTKTLNAAGKQPKSSAVEFTPLFNLFSVKVYISSPTNRRFDPPNFWPTIKPLIDGLTDCCYWVDDDWSHLKETSFLPDGVNKTKTDFVFRLVIEELPAGWEPGAAAPQEPAEEA